MDLSERRKVTRRQTSVGGMQQPVMRETRASASMLEKPLRSRAPVIGGFVRVVISNLLLVGDFAAAAVISDDAAGS